MKPRITKILGTLVAAALSFRLFASETVDVYKLTISLKVPQVVNNSQSLGKREYKRQKITGNLFIFYDNETGAATSIQMDSLVNTTFKVGGSPVKYRVIDDYLGIPQIWNVIGSNKTESFNQSSVCFNATLEPSYALTQANSDNSFVLVFSGTGVMKTWRFVDGLKFKHLNTISGYVVGTQGCGCHDYGHLSPTRIIGMCGPTSYAIDIASVYGIWKARFSHRMSK